MLYSIFNIIIILTVILFIAKKINKLDKKLIRLLTNVIWLKRYKGTTCYKPENLIEIF